MTNANRKGKWISIASELPTTSELKLVLTDRGMLGLAAYVDDEWVQFMPTYLGEVQKWCKFVGDDGDELSIELEPEPVIPLETV